MDLSVVVAFCSCLVPVLASSMRNDGTDDYDSPFRYDYESLRIGGLVFAATICILGIVLVFSKKCQCKSNKQSRAGSADPEAPTLNS
ncbi:FXYD domain containing ion transport regulator 6 like isoform X2 [Clupea harengus]|uniref:FXYD domain-containing ion transport regulator n=1 Tax=Clupea harengus TaxID=7950 RepID=A0A6P8G9H5_CLUHA|nr:FXYD domain containing ion transport regulator 6 like isoform X2 [Clupea harengus]XP_031432218.1 FXYD domain containing ion transport regulator 6 like isoform X2 [Clupea harengus]